MPVAPLVSAIRDGLLDLAEPTRAPRMQAYMKSAMPYRGVPMPAVRAMTRIAANTSPPADLDELESVVRTLWDGAQFREERYAAAELLRLPKTAGCLDLVPLYAHLARTGAWWDHVDDLAHLIADLHDTHPAETAEVVLRWSLDDDLWLRRLAILSQLGRGDRLDTALLTQVVEPSIDSTEFFLRKAIGWALREYARVDPDWVRAFVAAHEPRLSGLTKREALKHVG